MYWVTADDGCVPQFPDPGALSVPTACVCKFTFFCFSLLPLKHLLLWRQRLLQELHVKLILLLHFLLLPETHLVAYVALEAEAQRDHWVADTTEVGINRRIRRSTFWTESIGAKMHTDHLFLTLCTNTDTDTEKSLTSVQRKDDTSPHGSSSGLWIWWLPLCTQRVSTEKRWADRRLSLKKKKQSRRKILIGCGGNKP